jgi:hypothetical protein
MDIENAPDHSQGSDQQTQAKDGPPPKEMALLERFLNRIGFFVPKYIVMYEPLTSLLYMTGHSFYTT